MGDCKAGNPEVEVGEDLIVAAKSIARALGSKKNLTNGERKILADLGTKLSSLMTNRSTLNEIQVEDFGDIEVRLTSIQDKVLGWEADQTMIWDSSANEANEYLNTVEEAHQLIESLESLCLSKDDEKYELLHKANDVLQTAMIRLEDEFRYMLVQNRQPCAPEHMSFRSCEEDAVDENSLMSFGDDSIEDSFQRDSVSRASEDSIIDLVRPEVIPDLRSIANMMFNCNYDQECTQAYTNLRRDALDECLSYLEIQKLSIEDVRKMEWVSLNSKIRRWVWVMKIFVRIYLASEKWLSEQIFEELGPVRLDCFVEASKASILQLLNFAEAMSIGPHQPEKLVRILDMYEVLADVLPDIDALYFGEAGSSVSMECHDVLLRLGDSVKATVIEFENAIASNPSTNPVSGGGIHPLTRYVMNYMRTLTDYGQTLDLLLKDCDEGDPISLSPDTSPTKEEENKSTDSSGRKSPMAHQFLSFASSLEANLDEKSKLYKDASLQHVFLMNNIHYMAQKVKGAELRLIFGDDWIRKHNRKFQQHAMSYQRASWSYILSLLKEEGIQNPGSNSISKSLLKERLRSFYLTFEEIYKVQSAWLIPDPQLREDLQISTSLNVIQAYRTFVGRHSNDISDKLIKYSADDMENYLMDLFEGSSKLLQNSSRR
ncbi:putative exocyst complex component Exo70, cullin repeat-like-containing domain-containing protein [Rosa chinensis]|uniref:Exocyst subunit Exo70 family protein n=1 Tax=Rosa chinensis TaxID=74649 RepID=A0A2P6S3X2_ROSCH|nr:exocyst complex component EXO70E2 [Rosa chinensis]PRQ53380.1 putative exocyst complex component Exo70, cullin repeat-like-containing domain-containing protein [Rosa chinensis]